MSYAGYFIAYHYRDCENPNAVWGLGVSRGIKRVLMRPTRKGAPANTLKILYGWCLVCAGSIHAASSSRRPCCCSARAPSARRPARAPCGPPPNPNPTPASPLPGAKGKAQPLPLRNLSSNGSCEWLDRASWLSGSAPTASKRADKGSFGRLVGVLLPLLPFMGEELRWREADELD